MLEDTAMLQRIRKWSYKVLRQLGPDWPRPVFDLVDEPVLLLLLTPPNSGSTAIADYVGQSQEVMGLNNRYEGQWLLKGLCADDRYDGDKHIDWDSVKAVWFKTIGERKQLAPGTKYVFEKSPPNMMRYASIAALFRNSAVVVNNRNPFAYISSTAFRYRDFADLNTGQRALVVEEQARSWLKRSCILKEIVDQNAYPMLSYEEFCEDPARIFAAFGVQHLQTGIEDAYTVTVKDYPEQGIVNMNARQVGRLRDEEIRRIEQMLSEHEELLAFFNYQPGWQDDSETAPAGA